MPHQGEGNIEKLHPTSSLFSNIPVSVQLIYLGLVLFHCLKQRPSMKRQTWVMGGVASRRHIWEKVNKGPALWALAPGAASLFHLPEFTSGLNPLTSGSHSTPESGKNSLGDGVMTQVRCLGTRPAISFTPVLGAWVASVLSLESTVRFSMDWFRVVVDFSCCSFEYFVLILCPNELLDRKLLGQDCHSLLPHCCPLDVHSLSCIHDRFPCSCVGTFLVEPSAWCTGPSILDISDFENSLL